MPMKQTLLKKCNLFLFEKPILSEYEQNTSSKDGKSQAFFARNKPNCARANNDIKNPVKYIVKKTFAGTLASVYN